MTMTATEAAQLLTYIAAWDNRRVSAEIARVWADGLPDWLTPGIGMEAARRYFTEAAAPSEGTYLSPKVLIWYARKVRLDYAAEAQERLQRAGARFAEARAGQALTSPRTERTVGLTALAKQLDNYGKAPS